MEHSYCLDPKEAVDTNFFDCNSNQCSELSSQEIISYCLSFTNDIVMEKEHLSMQRTPQLDYLLNLIKPICNETVARDVNQRKRNFPLISGSPLKSQRPIGQDNLPMISLTKKQKLEGYYIFLDKTLDLARNKHGFQRRHSTAESQEMVDEYWSNFLSPFERETISALAISESWTTTNVKTRLSDDLENIEPMPIDNFAKIVAAMLSNACECKQEVASGPNQSVCPPGFCCACSTIKTCPDTQQNCHCGERHLKDYMESADNVSEDEDQFCKEFSLQNYLDFQDDDDPISDRSFEE